jgi:hypothetical protein
MRRVISAKGEKMNDRSLKNRKTWGRMVLFPCLVVVLCSLSGLLSAGEKLDIKGSFNSELKNGFPEGWVPNKPSWWDEAGTLALKKIPGTEKKALQITSQTKPMVLMYWNKKWPVADGDTCVIKAIAKGKGSMELGLYYYPGSGLLKKGFDVADEWTEYTAEILIPKASGNTANPVISEVVINLEASPGSSVEFADVTAEIRKTEEIAGIPAGHALTGGEPTYSVYPLPQAPEMDGKWDESVWKAIPSTANFKVYKNGGAVTRRRTGFKMGTYKDNLYIAVKCEEPQPDKVKTDPDNYSKGWYPDDNLEFFFSHDKSQRGYKQFVVNSRAARWCNLSNAADSWQAVSHTDADSWSVEVKIPFSLLGIGGDMTADVFLFNLVRAAYNNPDNVRFSSFAPVQENFGDVKNFALLTFFKNGILEDLRESREALNPARKWIRHWSWKIGNFKDRFLAGKQFDETYALSEDLSEAQKTLNPLRNWMRERLWKIANVKEGFLAARKGDENIQELLALKQRAKAILELKNMDGAFELIRQYDEQIDLNTVIKKRLAVEVQNRDAKTKLYMDGKELLPDSSGKYTVRFQEGVSVFGMMVTANGKNPGVRLRIAGQPDLESRWRAGTATNESWQTAAFDDRSWKAAELDKEGFLLIPQDSTGDVCFRQIVLWGESHYSGLPCLQPKVREWGFSEKSMETFFHTLYSPPPLTFPLEDYEFILDVPKGFQLLKEKYANDFKGGKLNRRPQKVTEEEVKHENQPYTRYRFAFESAFVQPGNQASKIANNNQVALIPLLLSESQGADKLCKFYFRRMASGNLTELERTLPVRILPPLNGRMPKKVMLGQYLSLPWMRYLGEANGGQLFPEHFEAHMRQSMDVGFNSWTISPTGDAYTKKVQDRVLERGGVVVLWGPNNYPLYGANPKGALGQLMQTAPEFRARFFNDPERIKTAGQFCRSFATGEGAAQFKEAVKKDIGFMLGGSADLNFLGFPKAAVYWVDWEQEVWVKAPAKSFCFCENCKTAFRQYAKLPDSVDLSDDAIVKNYKREWSLFRNELDGRMNGIVREACNELGLQYMYYDQVAFPDNWPPLKGKIDIAFPGWPGDGQAIGNGSKTGVSSFAVTQRSLDGEMTFLHDKVGVSHIQGQMFASAYPYGSRTPWESWTQTSGSTKDGFLNAKGVKSQILRVIAAFHGGLDLNNSLERCAGQPYYIGEATRLIAEYEDLFYDGKREDSLAASDQLQYPNLLVLTKGDERLVLLFNETDRPVTVQLNNKDLKSGQCGTVFGSSEKIDGPEKMSVTVDAGDVAAVHIR